MNIKCIITISNKFEIQMQLIKSFKNMYNIKNIKEQIKLSHVCFLEQHKWMNEPLYFASTWVSIEILMSLLNKLVNEWVNE